jgi:hypothetical protein
MGATERMRLGAETEVALVVPEVPPYLLTESYAAEQVAPDRLYMVVSGSPLDRDYDTYEIVLIAGQSWLRYDDSPWEATVHLPPPPRGIGESIHDPMLAQVLPTLTARDTGPTYELASDFDVYAAVTLAATRGHQGFLSRWIDFPAADVSTITGSWSAVVTKPALYFSEIKYRVVIPLLEPIDASAAWGAAYSAGTIELRSTYWWADFDDPSITIEPPLDTVRSSPLAGLSATDAPTD